MILNKLFKKYTFKKAQSLVEFALVAPVLILFLLLIVQFGYAINIRNVLSSGAKDSLMQVNSKLNNLTGNASTKKTSMETALKANMEAFLTSHAISNASSVTVKVNTNANGVTYANFTYMYKLILPLMPGITSIPLQTSQVISSQMLQVNNFNSGLTSQQLSSFFPTSSGALTTGGTISGFNIRDNTAILVNWFANNAIDTSTGLVSYENVANVNVTNYARLYSWYGEDLLPANMRLCTRTGSIWIRSPYYNSGKWLNTQIPYVWLISALGYTQVLYTSYNSTVDIHFYPGTGSLGYMLNTCDISDHYGAASSPGDTCPLVWGQGSSMASWYPYLYKINPLEYDQTNHAKFNRSFGYRWCDAAGMPACTSNQSGSHSIQELALKGITREGVYCTNHGLDYKYNRHGNYEQTRNTAVVSTLQYFFYNILTGPSFQMTPKNNLFRALQHYTVRSSDYNNYDGNYVINIFQPVINNAAGNYYTAGVDDVDPVKMILEDANTNDANGNGTPLFKAFQWRFRLTSGIYDKAGGASNIDIVDVYMDTDGDGIPDAWDDRPIYFDANANGKLDGLESSVTFNAALNTQSDKSGTAYVFPVPGVIPIISPPFDNAGNLRDSKKNNGTLQSYIPQPIFSNYRVFSGRLYVACDLGDGDGMDDLCRQAKAWSPIPLLQLNQKSRFINGTSNGTVINLDRSAELDYLDNNNFSVANRVIKTSVGW